MLTTRFVNGAPNWVDVGTSDIAGATSFYRALFGWEFRSAGSESGGYGFFQLDGRTAAGGMQITPEQGPPGWNVFFRSQDADATARAVERAGGTVLMPPGDVMDKGRVAMFADPSGVRFGVWQPDVLTGLDVVAENGSLSWAELYTRDVARGAAFYAAVFGWETSGVSFPGGVYTCVNPAGAGEDAMFAGLVDLADDPSGTETEPYWLPYFAVEDVDGVVARAGELGGKVRMPATDIEGVGRMAKLDDPYGARFAVMRFLPPEN
ncbi:VOC family protein [Streptomyces sp. NPDC048002]|uniref:VOC family protein n=1 Tax=unclassified Streptomyces TaxID=2593676 RepID=UPI0033DC9B4B